MKLNENDTNEGKKKIDNNMEVLKRARFCEICNLFWCLTPGLKWYLKQALVDTPKLSMGHDILSFLW